MSHGCDAAGEPEEGPGRGEWVSAEAEPPDEQTGSGDDASGESTFKRPGRTTLGLNPELAEPSIGAGGHGAHLDPGEQLAGRFTIVRFVARGGMGAVYEATDVLLRSRVALKLLEGPITTDAAAIERFRREVLLSRRVSHPNVCRVYELYESRTAAGTVVQFLVMEFLEGETLAQRIARAGRLTTAEALPLVEQMCAGLAAAHAEGVIHRDFKSGNVMLVPHGSGEGHGAPRVAITDFGIARALGSVVGEEALTGAAGIVGTPEYMAPEQVTGGEISPATDVYALGVVMYQLVTGQLPFSGATPLATAVRHIEQPPPRAELAAPGLDPRWSRTIRRCLDRDPHRRYQSAGDVVAELSGRPRRRWLPLAAGLAVLLLLLGGVLLARRTPPSTGATSPSIAVLPFVDMSAEHDQEYFSDGVAQEIINALAQVPSLRVAARSSSFYFKGKSEDLRAVGQKLNVAHVLEGSVRKSGTRLRVTAQLVNAADGYQLWSQSFDRDLADVFAVQDEIARAVVTALKMRVLSAGEGKGRRATTPEAYNHYLRGLQLQNKGTIDSLHDAIEEYGRAIAADVSYAPAHARLAESLLRYGNSGSWDLAETQRLSQSAQAEAERAVEFDSTRVDGFAARGFSRTVLSWDWPGARDDFERAMALSPGDVNARARYGHLLAVLGRMPEAIPVVEDALELDPLSSETRYWLATLYNATAKYAAARELLHKALELAPQHDLAKREVAFTELLDGHPSLALATVPGLGQDWTKSLVTALAQHSLGNRRESDAALARLVSAAGTTATYQIAQVHAWRGEQEEAFDWLERARLRHDPGLRYLKYDPFLRSLRGDSRFASLLEKLKLPPG